MAQLEVSVSPFPSFHHSVLIWLDCCSVMKHWNNKDVSVFFNNNTIIAKIWYRQHAFKPLVAYGAARSKVLV